jgi:hypothetical protein
VEDYGVAMGAWRIMEFVFLEFLTLAWELEYEQGHFFKRGRVQALGKVPVGMQGDANAPFRGVGVGVSGQRQEKGGEGVRLGRTGSSHCSVGCVQSLVVTHEENKDKKVLLGIATEISVGV